MSWDDELVLTSNRRFRNIAATSTIGGVAAYGGPVQYAFTSCNTATITGTIAAGSITNVLWTNYPSGTGFVPSGITSGGGCYYNGGGGQPRFDPAQVEALRKDFKSVRESWKRKRAEVRAKRLFRRVVGDIAYVKFQQRGYHEITGASGARYRLEPGRWVQVMKGCADQVDYELCAHLEIGIPWFDTLVVQHLMLTSGKESEEKFLGIANKHQAGYYPLEELRHRAA
jgi:hypothetical protein